MGRDVAEIVVALDSKNIEAARLTNIERSMAEMERLMRVFKDAKEAKNLTVACAAHLLSGVAYEAQKIRAAAKEEAFLLKARQ